ncbi:MAG TPA: cation:proton antiporter, partial [Devosiaceae bacterium]|nr:cation:proton antiporter [Devosiaceae bacterium]
MKFRGISHLVLLAPALLLAGLWVTPAYAAGGELPSLVHDIGISLLTAGVLAVIFNRLKVPSIAAFLVAGVLIGPLLLGQVTEAENVDTIAQLGFVLLLFMIGLEIDVRAIIKSGRTTIVAGLLQYPLCIAFGFGLVKFLMLVGFGGTLLAGDYTPIYVGIVMAGSSTLLVIKLFQ